MAIKARPSSSGGSWLLSALISWSTYLLQGNEPQCAEARTVVRDWLAVQHAEMWTLHSVALTSTAMNGVQASRQQDWQRCLTNSTITLTST